MMVNDCKLTLSRRRLMATAAGFGAGMALPALALAAPVPPSNQFAFSVWRKGSQIGEHRLTFREDGDDLVVDVDINLQVKLGFVTLFRYTHHNTEIWRDGKLVSLDSETHDDGSDFRLSVRPAGDVLDVDGWAGQFQVPADTLSSSYWNPDTIYRSRILDTQRGYLMDVNTEWLGEETIEAATGRIAANRYRISGDLTMDIWYSQGGQWVKLDFATRGSTISYQLT